MIGRGLSVIMIVLNLGTIAPAFAADRTGSFNWYFTAGEIDAAYRYQERFGRRLGFPLKPGDCYHGQKAEFVASFQGREFFAPCQFVTQTTRHLKQMLENRAARYLFPLDVDHAHLAIPKELWADKYSKLVADNALRELLREPKLVALYHTAEHLASTDPKTAKESGATTEWRAKRNVLGFFDGSPLTILSPRPDGAAQARPEHYEIVSTVYFLAHRLGEMVFSANGKAVTFDLSFDEDSAVVAP